MRAARVWRYRVEKKAGRRKTSLYFCCARRHGGRLPARRLKLLVGAMTSALRIQTDFCCAAAPAVPPDVSKPAVFIVHRMQAGTDRLGAWISLPVAVRQAAGATWPLPCERLLSGLLPFCRTNAALTNVPKPRWTARSYERRASVNRRHISACRALLRGGRGRCAQVRSRGDRHCGGVVSRPDLRATFIISVLHDAALARRPRLDTVAPVRFSQQFNVTAFPADNPAEAAS